MPSKESANARIDRQVKQLREKQKSKRDQIGLLSSPLLVFKIFFSVVVVDYFRTTFDYLKENYPKTTAFIISFFVFTTIVFYLVDEDPESGIAQVISVTELTFYNAIWWILLGVLSSVGLGTGLHTFVLYLGPLIAKATIAAHECNSVDFQLYGEDRFVCPTNEVDDTVTITIWAILAKVQFEGLMWGAGTAIGELPPYFVARAARETSESLDFLDEEAEGGWMEKYLPYLKGLMFQIVGNLGFFGILLFASIPNPLFDLAGITCGHFKVPFWTFFGATLIGKALIKAHIQIFFVLIMFSKERLNYIISTVETLVPFLEGQLMAIIENEKKKLHREGGVVVNKAKSWPAVAWDCFLILMLAYFLYSIVMSSVLKHFIDQDEEQVKKLLDKKNKQKKS